MYCVSGINEISEVNRVVYDISNKPRAVVKAYGDVRPATMEWE